MPVEPLVLAARRPQGAQAEPLAFGVLPVLVVAVWVVGESQF